MSTLKYKSAPVSEVIVGITFRDGVFKKNNYYLDLIARLSKEYPIYTIHGPLLNEELTNYQNNFISNPLLSGQVLYRLKSLDTTWLVQIQWNKLYLNWIRDDQKDVGSYPGYSAILNKFNLLLQDVYSELKISDNEVQYCELTYHDRIRWPEYINQIGNIDSIVNYTLPQFETKNSGGIEIVNFTKAINAKIDSLGGFMTFNFLTATEITGKQILKLELSTKGMVPGLAISDWFNKAHVVQVEVFEKMLNPEILKKWQQ